MLYVYESPNQWLVTKDGNLRLPPEFKAATLLSTRHQIILIKGLIQFLILDANDWAEMQESYPILYAAMFGIMYTARPRTPAARTLARLGSYMNTYDALALFYGYRNHAYTTFQGEGPHLRKPWSLFRFLRLTRKYLKEHKTCWEA